MLFTFQGEPSHAAPQGPPITTWLLKMGVSLRTRLLRRPYGDQGLFVRRATFQRLGGG